ncbi:MAG: hypothetical protein AB6733_09410 [Clostridiaceae bacterium]
MIYKFHNGSPDNIVRHVEYILPMIGNIKEFEVFRNYEDTPYQAVEDDERVKYTFILKDDNNNEFWLNSLCGYGGSGPGATLKILQLLGIKQDFNVCKEGIKHIKQKKLNPIHKLNLLIAQNKSLSIYTDDDKFLFMLNINFKYAYQKSNFIKALKLLGWMEHVIPENRELFEIADAFDGIVVPDFEYYYYTNNIFTFNNEFKEFSPNQIQVIVESLARNNGGEFKKEFDI